jgi:hypothetical protein
MSFRCDNIVRSSQLISPYTWKSKHVALFYPLKWKGRAIAQAVSRWLPTAAARVWQVGFMVDKVALG